MKNPIRFTAMAALAAMLTSGLSLAATTKTTTTKKTTTARKTTTTKTVAKKPASAEKGPDRAKLLDPSKLTAKAPAVFRARFETSKGPFVIEVHRDWAPKGADRFYNLVKNGYYDDVRFFRVLSGFMAQFGINGDPKLNDIWHEANIEDDPVRQSNTRGMVSYAMRGPGSRTTQLFINFADRNSQLDRMGFAPFGKVVEGMEIVDKLYSGYGEGAPQGGGPAQDRAQEEGNAYLKASFPELDYVKTARIVTEAPH
ncbi:MAG TPA: peptidylprolyl isomerase [Thermoanaerobaculia bacterium]|nr:peptidylprolyl isomerase [Thermoanaerobaculia bacterium]